jgi:hypothetical protein
VEQGATAVGGHQAAWSSQGLLGGRAGSLCATCALPAPRYQRVLIVRTGAVLGACRGAPKRVLGLHCPGPRDVAAMAPTPVEKPVHRCHIGLAHLSVPRLGDAIGSPFACCVEFELNLHPRSKAHTDSVGHAHTDTLRSGWVGSSGGKSEEPRTVSDRSFCWVGVRSSSTATSTMATVRPDVEHVGGAVRIMISG